MQITVYHFKSIYEHNPVADPGFPVGVGRGGWGTDPAVCKLFIWHNVCRSYLIRRLSHPLRFADELIGVANAIFSHCLLWWSTCASNISNTRIYFDHKISRTFITTVISLSRRRRTDRSLGKRHKTVRRRC